MAGPPLDWKDIGRHLKLRDLQILAAVVHRGSMAKGAAHLGISQPSVSEAVANLEAVLGVRLLDRSTRGIEPTIYADVLLRRGHVAFDELRQGINDIAFLTNPTVGEVRIGCPELLSAGFVPAVINELSRKHPNIAVHVDQTQTAEQEFRELRDRSVDLMLGRLLKPLSDDDIHVEVLCDDRFVVAAGRGSPWATRRRIALEDLIDERWILFPETNVTSSYVGEAFQMNGLHVPRKIVASFSMHLRIHLLATGRFVTIVQDSVLRFNAKQWSLVRLPIELRIDPAPIVVFSLKNRTLSPVAMRFLEHARLVSKTMRNTAPRRQRPSE